ncbi:WD domain G-beta repeat [Carpediemonas membranifera]|uniref:WD domain G-beta repeat n=1 Tax=Carpediemonas membranifera TaxID=201153 RepID=A0A8J6E360_9EUKA|nr:WD domain G-beta repeat [Carpediemonas membranifera]|eukprot:KAG9395513.1 WD domain G-beta repeat [Carpediemonas membranifera]
MDHEQGHERPNGTEFRNFVTRKQVDIASSIQYGLEHRLQHHSQYYRPTVLDSKQHLRHILNPQLQMTEIGGSLLTRFIHSGANKNRSKVLSLGWSPDGRRLLTGNANGELTLWQCSPFKFDTVMEVVQGNSRDSGERGITSIQWMHGRSMMITADETGWVQYWQDNLNCIKRFRASASSYKALEVAIAPTDAHIAVAGDDPVIPIFDLVNPYNEAERGRRDPLGSPVVSLVNGHRSTVRGVDWHPHGALVLSGGEDGNTILWDVRSGEMVHRTPNARSLAIHRVRWEPTGQRFITVGKDQVARLYDVRQLHEPLRSISGDGMGAGSAVRFHPMVPRLFVVGDVDGGLYWFHEDIKAPVAILRGAHSSQQGRSSRIWDLAFHPAEHLMASVGDDHNTRFWARMRPGEALKDTFHSGQYLASSSSGGRESDRYVDLAQTQFAIERAAMKEDAAENQVMPWERKGADVAQRVDQEAQKMRVQAELNRQREEQAALQAISQPAQSDADMLLEGDLPGL